MNGTPAAVAHIVAEPLVRVRAADRSRSWRRVVIWAAACITLLDAALLQRKHGVFTGGFLASQQFGTVADGLAFLMMAALLNATVAAPLAIGAMAAGRRLRLRPRAVRFAAFAAAVLPLAVADFVTYQVWAYLGDAFDFHVMFALTGHRISEIFAVTAPLMSRPLFLFGLALCAIAATTAALHRSDARPLDSIVLPRMSTVLQRCFTLVLLSSMIVTGVLMTSDSMTFALRWMPAGQIFTLVLNRLSDVDRDGYGLLRNPRDSAALDPSIHPYAIDVPGNGIDENALGGDLPLEQASPPRHHPANGPWSARPPVILFVLESVRADAVGSFVNGRRVTPTIDTLAARGLKVESAWAHAGSTGQSRYHLLTGSLVDRREGTILDDFKNHGYEVAYFSGQDDDFGEMGIDYRRVDKFYDARQDVRNRYSTSTTPGSLAVPAAVVENRVREYLDGRRTQAPLFLYVNFHDTHYPYTHAGLDNLLGVELLNPSLISPGRRRDLSRTYLNATANVDRSIGRVLSAVEAHLGRRAAVIVVSDHGESLFEQGYLGHGFALNDAQTRVPLVITGLPVKITMPFGLADLRWAINDALGGGRRPDDPPVAQRSSTARVFQYLGTIDTPSQIGWLTSEGAFTYDFRSERIGVWDSSVGERDLAAYPRRLFSELVHTWEGMLLARPR